MLRPSGLKAIFGLVSRANTAQRRLAIAGATLPRRAIHGPRPLLDQDRTWAPFRVRVRGRGLPAYGRGPRNIAKLRGRSQSRRRPLALLHWRGASLRYGVDQTAPSKSLARSTPPWCLPRPPRMRIAVQLIGAGPGRQVGRRARDDPCAVTEAGHAHGACTRRDRIAACVPCGSRRTARGARETSEGSTQLDRCGPARS